MEIVKLKGRAVLPPVLASAMRRAIVFQVGVMAGIEAVFVLGALSAQQLVGTDRLYGVSPVTPYALGQVLVALPAGAWMDRWGRRPVLLTGALVEAAALIVLGSALLLGSPALFLLGLFFLGLGSGTAQLVFLLGGDYYPPQSRGEGLSLMSTFAAVGVFAGPYIVGLFGDWAEKLGWDPLVSPWFAVSGIIAVVAWIIAGLRPEPLHVSREPDRYYPDSKVPSIADNPGEGQRTRSLPQLLKIYPVAASIGMTVCFEGVRMSIVPLLAFILRTQGYSLTASAAMVAAMGLGMILGSYPAGLAGDRWGRRPLLLLSIAVALICTLIVPLSESMPLMFVALVLLGASFASVLNMSRAMVADVTQPRERGAALATSSLAIGTAVILFPTIASYVRTIWNWNAIAVLGAVLLGAAFVLALLLRERGVGQWDHRGVSVPNEPSG